MTSSTSVRNAAFFGKCRYDPASGSAQPSGEGAETSAEAEEKPAEKPDLDSLMAELDSLIGLESVKREVRSLVNLIKVRRLREENGLPEKGKAESVEEVRHDGE